MPSLLITFEGIDGSGKSTQAALLRDALRSRGRAVDLTREPGGTPLGEEIRSILLHHRDKPLCRDAEFLLYMAARAQLVHDYLQPRLSRDGIVLLDRYYHSTAAYQGGPNPEQVLRWCRELQFPPPNHVFLLDLSPELALKRAGRTHDRIESRGATYFTEVRQRFLRLASVEASTFTVLDATRRPEELHQIILTVTFRIAGIAPPT